MLEFVTENLVWVVVVGIVIIMTFIGYLAEKTDFGRKSIEKRELRAKRKAEEKEKLKQEKIEKEIQKEKELAEKRANAEKQKEEAVIEEPAKEEPKKKEAKKKDKKKGNKKEEALEVPVEAVVVESDAPIIMEPVVNPVEATPIEQETIESLSVPLEPMKIPTVPAVEDSSIAVEVFDPIVSDIQTIPETETLVTMEPVVNPMEPDVNQVVESNPFIEEKTFDDNLVNSPVEVMDVIPTAETDPVPQDISTIIPIDTSLPDIGAMQNTQVNDEDISEDDDVWKF